MGQASTDDTGAYRLPNLLPGRYYVVAESVNHHMIRLRESPAAPGKPQIRPVRTFHPGSLSRASAALEVKPGQETPGTDIRMRSIQTFHIRGKVAGTASNGSQPQFLMLSERSGDRNSFGFRGPGFLGPDRTFDFSGVTPGSYVIIMANFGGSEQPARSWKSARLM